MFRGLIRTLLRAAKFHFQGRSSPRSPPGIQRRGEGASASGGGDTTQYGRTLALRLELVFCSHYGSLYEIAISSPFPFPFPLLRSPLSFPLKLFHLRNFSHSIESEWPPVGNESESVATAREREREIVKLSNLANFAPSFSLLFYLEG